MQRYFAFTLILVFSVMGQGLFETATPIYAENFEKSTSNTTTLAEHPQLKQAFTEAIGRDNPDYHIQTAANSFVAANSNQKFEVIFDTHGITVQLGSDTWQMTLTDYGYGEYLQAVETPVLSTEANRLTYQRGNLSEWYINSQLGLEQGFTLTERPQISATSDLTLRFNLGGSLSSELRDDVLYLGETNLTYGGLVAYDALGQTLPAYLSLTDSQLLIRVDDTHATYPLTIDPLVQQQKLLPIDGGSDDWFGASVAVEGNTALIGAPLDDDNGIDSGSAYIFARSGITWNQQQKLLPTDGAADDRFGTSVALAGDGSTALIGAPLNDIIGSNSGSAYVFTRGVLFWSQQARLGPTDGAANDQFGISVALAGDGSTVLIGAIFDDDNGSNSGSAYIFVRNVTVWIEWFKLLPTDGAAGDRFGTSVALVGDGNTALIGAPLDDDNGTDSGSAYVFAEDNFVWTQEAKLLPANGSAGDEFGGSVALAGDGSTALIGVRLDDDNGSNSGSAYIFVRNVTVWIEWFKLLPTDGSAEDEFGKSVALAGDGNTALIGAHRDDTTQTDSGSAYVFVEGNFVWTQEIQLRAIDGAISDRFGVSVALAGNGDTALIGAHFDDNSGLDSGSAYAFATGNSALALFNPLNSDTSLHTSLLNNPNSINYTNAPPTSTDPIWVMGDWDGDSLETPGYFDSGVFRYTYDIGTTTIWSAGIWLGNAGTRVGVVSGRYATGFPNDNGNDCIGWVDSNTSPVTGDLRFSLKYWCDMTASGAVALSAQWLSSPLGDSGGFLGTHQWVYGDWDNDNLDEPAVRRGGRITRSNTAPSEGAATYPPGSAQRWDTADGDGPGGNALNAGQFVAGDWNGDGIDTFGVTYTNNTFYYRDVFGWNPGPFEFSSQTFTTSIGTTRQVVSHNLATGGSSAPGPASPNVVRGLENGGVSTGGTFDTSRNAEAELSVGKTGNYTVGKVGLVGDSIVWTITVANTGTAPANGVQITDNVPAELRVDDALADSGVITVRGQAVIFNVETIGVGETVQFQVVTTILGQPSSGIFANSVNVVLPDGNGSGSDANLVASGTVNSVDALPATGYTPKFRW